MWSTQHGDPAAAILLTQNLTMRGSVTFHISYRNVIYYIRRTWKPLLSFKPWSQSTSKCTLLVGCPHCSLGLTTTRAPLSTSSAELMVSSQCTSIHHSFMSRKQKQISQSSFKLNKLGQFTTKALKFMLAHHFWGTTYCCYCHICGVEKLVGLKLLLSSMIGQKTWAKPKAKNNKAIM